MRLFSVAAFRFSIVDPQSAIGKWSRIATFGPKSKDGERMVFDASTLGEMVDNAAARGDMIAICNDHASAYPETRDAPALGFFGALAVVAAGKVVKFWNAQPDPAGMEDGLYARLDEVTPRGADPLVGLANYKTLSPFFASQGKGENDEAIGYSLLDVGATNVPFQAGAELTFHRLSAASEKNPIQPGASRLSGAPNMDEATMKRFGIEPNDDEPTKAAKMTKFWNDHDAAMAKMTAAPEESEEEKKKREEAEKMSAAEPDGDEKEAVAALAKMSGLPATSSRKAILMAAAAGGVIPMAKVQAMVTEQVAAALTADKAQRAEVEAGEKATALGNRYQKFGAAADQVAGIVKLARIDFAAAESVVNAHPAAKAMGRMTAGGNPIGAERGNDLAPAPERSNGAIVTMSRLSATAKQLVKDGKAKDIASAQIMAIRADASLGDN